MNENDLGQLVNLLSYLKKHDDVESEIQKRRAERRPPVGFSGKLMRETTPEERFRTGQTFTDVPLGAPMPGASGTGYSTAAGGSASAYQTSDSSDPGIGPSSVPSSRTQEIQERKTVSDTSSDSTPEGTEDSEGIIEPYKDYTPEGDEIGPRQGRFRRLGDTPIEAVTAPSTEDTSDSSEKRDFKDIVTDDDREVLDWLHSEGYTLSDIKQMIEDYTSPPSKKKETPIHHVIRSNPNDRISKSNESVLLKLLDKLGI